MATDSSDSRIPVVLAQAIKSVPALGILVWLWRFAINYGFDHWQLLVALPKESHRTLAWILAVLLALITWYVGNVWDDHVFDPLYTVKSDGFRGKLVDKNTRGLFGLLPAGSTLQTARRNAMTALKLPSEDDLYMEAKTELQRQGKWTKVGGLLFLSKLCRSLLLPCFLIAAALIIAVVYEWITGQTINSTNLCFGGGSLLIGLFLFIPYIGTRVEHMTEMYQEVSKPRIQKNL